MSRTNRATVTVNAELRRKLVGRQAAMEAAGTGLGAGGALSAGGALAPAERRAVLTAAATAVLADRGWTVTVVHGDTDHYTGIEASRGDEHLLAAVGADDLITDQAGAHDCAATLDAILSGLRADGAEVKVTSEVAHDGRGGSLYAVAGGPTRAHAIAATLRQGAVAGRPAGRRRGPDRLRNTNGER